MTALRQQDLATAEREAAAALDASVMASGDGGRTAVLAMNLANIRLRRQDPGGALAPARKALGLADAAGWASGVDATAARLAVARAELPGGGDFAIGRLEGVLADALAEPDLLADCYAGAVELGQFAFEKRRFVRAKAAWNTVEQILLRSPGRGSAVALGRARLEQAAAGILEQADRDRGVIIRTDQGLGPYSGYNDLLVKVLDALVEEARTPGPTVEPTAAQSVYAEAVAWHRALRAKLGSDHRDADRLAEPEEWVSEIGAARHSLPRCDGRVSYIPKPKYPPSSLVTGGVGAVVLKLGFDETGLVEHVHLAGSVGGPDFSRAVTDVAHRWRLVRQDPSESGCRLAREIFASFQFAYD